MDDVVIVPDSLDLEWCDYCLNYTTQETRKFVDGHHYDGKKLVLHVKFGTQCLQCGLFNERTVPNDGL